jgi:predicted Zn finger-like uncharacterized protein
MRLICPNCDAQYELDPSAIPATGRDVQCSSCGHGWFQLHPDVETERAAESALHDAPAMPDPATVARADADEVIADPDPQPRQVDEAVLAVLREEAEREMIARRLEAEAPIETQTELGIDSAAAVSAKSATARHLARLKGEDPDAEPEAKRELTRREMLPDIEEINSSLRPGERAIDDDGAAFEVARRPAPRSGFRSGFVLMLLLAVAVIAVYAMAPRIAEQFPGAKPALDTYVAGVDNARAWLDTATRNVVTSLRGLAGTDQPAP